MRLIPKTGTSASDFKNKSCEVSGEFSIVFFLPRLMVVAVTRAQGEMQHWQRLAGCGEPCCREHGSAALLLLSIPHKEETK